MDELTTGLDPHAARVVGCRPRIAIAARRRPHTHFMEEAERLCDRARSSTMARSGAETVGGLIRSVGASTGAFSADGRSTRSLRRSLT